MIKFAYLSHVFSFESHLQAGMFVLSIQACAGGQIQGPGLMYLQLTRIMSPSEQFQLFFLIAKTSPERQSGSKQPSFVNPAQGYTLQGDAARCCTSFGNFCVSAPTHTPASLMLAKSAEVVWCLSSYRTISSVVLTVFLKFWSMGFEQAVTH